MNTETSRSVVLSSMVAWWFSMQELPAQWVSHPAPRQGFPAVYVDRSHEWHVTITSTKPSGCSGNAKRNMGTTLWRGCCVAVTSSTEFVSP